MTYLTSTPTAGPSAVRDRADRHTRGREMLIFHEALARSRQHEAEQAAREHTLARKLVAGRRWTMLARFATRRAERARAAAGEVPLTSL